MDSTRSILKANENADEIEKLQRKINSLKSVDHNQIRVVCHYSAKRISVI